MAMIVSQAQMATSVEEEPAATATSAATISVLDAVRVMGSLTWWGVDLAMETAGYGKCFSRVAMLGCRGTPGVQEESSMAFESTVE